MIQALLCMCFVCLWCLFDLGVDFVCWIILFLICLILSFGYDVCFCCLYVLSDCGLLFVGNSVVYIDVIGCGFCFCDLFIIVFILLCLLLVFGGLVY